jgi:hypothetical protein
MLTVILYFFLCALISYGIGVWLCHWLKLEDITIVITIFLGLIGIQCLSAVWSFFGGLSWLWTVFMMLLSLSAYVAYFSEIKTQMRLLRFSLSRKRIPVLLVTLATISLAFVASGKPYFIDNESYYIQTINWLDQYGLVKGVSNVHLFLSQHSGFHILQSALNLDFFYGRFNDLAAFYLLLGFGWSLTSFKGESQILAHYRRFYVVIFSLGYLFSSAPSPDLPVYVLSYIVIYYFLKLWEQYEQRWFWFMMLCIMQIALIKVISVLLIILPMVLLLKWKSIRSVLNAKLIFVAALFTGLYLGKSFIINGMPLYPLTSWTPFNVSWQLPQELAELYTQLTFSQSFGVHYKYLDQYDFWQRLGLWWSYPGMEGVFNKVTAVFLGLQLVSLFLPKIPKSIKAVLLVCLLQSVVLFATSPQFRFFANLLFPTAVLLVVFIIPQVKKLHLAATFVVLGVGFSLAVFDDVKNELTDNELMKSVETSATHWIFPLKNSRKDVNYKLIQRPDFYHYSIEDGDFIFSTYDAPIPAVQNALLEWITTDYQLQPKMIGTEIKEGFKSSPVD